VDPATYTTSWDANETTLALAEEGRFPSAFAVARTALEHHLLDRLLLLADRYEEIVRPLDPELLEEWEQAWVQRTEEWTRDLCRSSG
jgi:hypothetical protein